MMLGGFEEKGEGENAAEQVRIEEERGDTIATETEELPSSEEKEEAEREAAPQGPRRSSRQRGADTEEGGCS